MSYRVLARKYRPQRFQEIVGQGPITQTLQNAIASERLAQAYLFVGPRGVGKTSTARIFAKALNCHQGPTTDPCGKCDACVEIAEGRSLDVLEIDGASNNSVESIRTLRENAAFAPAHGPYKIYLIDEVHMLTTAAFNALLKTLEEPPAHVKFLFATTEAQKVPATITSRCQRFDLRRLSEKDIAEHLLYIASQENVTLSEEAAATLARGADGALRDAESMLDQVISFCGATISDQDVQHIFGFTSSEIVHQLGTALFQHDVPQALHLIAEQSQEGKDLSRLLGDFIKFLRDLLIDHVNPTGLSSSELSADISPDKLLTLLDYLGEAEGRLRWSLDKKLQLEVTMIKAIHLLQEVSLSEVIDVLTSLRGGEPLPATERKTIVPTPQKTPAASIKKPVPPITPAPEKPTSSQPSHLTLASKVPETAATSSTATSPEKAAEKMPEPPPKVAAKPKEPSQATSAGEMSQNVAELWKTVASSLAAESQLKFGWLETGKFLKQQENKIIIEFSSSLASQTETLFWHQARKKIQDRLSADLNQKVEFLPQFTGEALPEEPPEEIIEEPPAQQPPQAAAKEPEAPSSTMPAAAEESGPAKLTPEEMEDFKNDPLIKKALEVFQAEII